MKRSRRDFLARSADYAARFSALTEWATASPAIRVQAEDNEAGRYGALSSDVHGLLDLPSGFAYQVISRAGQHMDDGYIVPAKPDGMATFLGPDGLTILVRNYELLPDEEHGAFGPNNLRLRTSDAAMLYDRGGGRSLHRGGTTTLVYDKKQQIHPGAPVSKSCGHIAKLRRRPDALERLD